MTKEFVQQYARLEQTHWWFVTRQKIILQFIKKQLPQYAGEQLHILNIGAAGGASSEWLAAFGKVVSVETDPLFIQYLEEKKVAVTEASITKLPFADNMFDLVCAFDVIEHVQDDEQAIKEMSRVCKNKGALCISVPALPSLWSPHDRVNGHFRRYTKKTLRSLLAKFPVVKETDIRYFNSLLFPPVWIIRKFSNIFRKESAETQSDFSYFKTPALINSMLRKIFGLELFLMKYFNFPVGVSLIVFLKKDNSQP